jgi:DNA-binding transcriptional MerR regulator
VRNVRVYQARGLLAPPRLAGRVGWYSDAHLTRLRLIGRLLARGYTFAVMKELLTAWEAGGDLSDVLGLEDVLIRPWTDEAPVALTLADLREKFGEWATEENIDRSVALGLLEREGDDVYRAPIPRLVTAGAELVAFGVPVPEVHELAAALRDDLNGVAARFVKMLRGRVLPGDAMPPADQVAEIVAALERLRPLASAAVMAIFGQAMQDQIADALGQSARRAAQRNSAAATPVATPGATPAPTAGRDGPSVRAP